MKKLYALLSLLAIGSLSFAQQSHSIEQAIPRTVKMTAAPVLEDGRTAGVVDTIYDYLDRSTDFFLLTAGSAGYTLGTNGFTREVAVHYDGLGVLKVTEAMVFFTEKEIMLGIADEIKAYAYKATADSMPGDTLGRGSISFTNIDTSGFATFIPLTIEDSVTGGFLVGIDYYDAFNIDDSIAILSNNVLAANGGPDGGLERRTRQRLNNGNWIRVYDLWNFSGNPMDADAMILPVIDYTEIVGVEEAVRASELTLYPAWPNPATDLLHIPISLEKPQQVRVTLYDLDGRPVHATAPVLMGSGRNELTVPTSQLADGIYYFRLDAGKEALAGKVVVAK